MLSAIKNFLNRPSKRQKRQAEIESQYWATIEKEKMEKREQDCKKRLQEERDEHLKVEEYTRRVQAYATRVEAFKVQIDAWAHQEERKRLAEAVGMDLET